MVSKRKEREEELADLANDEAKLTRRAELEDVKESQKRERIRSAKDNARTEFPYIDILTEDEKNDILKRLRAYIDPGKKTLLI